LIDKVNNHNAKENNFNWRNENIAIVKTLKFLYVNLNIIKLKTRKNMEEYNIGEEEKEEEKVIKIIEK
jgi:hypothetical protein